MTDRYRRAAEELADAAGELIFEWNKRGKFTHDTLSALAMAERQFRYVEKDMNND